MVVRARASCSAMDAIVRDYIRVDWLLNLLLLLLLLLVLLLVLCVGSSALE